MKNRLCSTSLQAIALTDRQRHRYTPAAHEARAESRENHKFECYAHPLGCAFYELHRSSPEVPRGASSIRLVLTGARRLCPRCSKSVRNVGRSPARRCGGSTTISKLGAPGRCRSSSPAAAASVGCSYASPPRPKRSASACSESSGWPRQAGGPDRAHDWIRLLRALRAKSAPAHPKQTGGCLTCPLRWRTCIPVVGAARRPSC